MSSSRPSRSKKVEASTRVKKLAPEAKNGTEDDTDDQIEINSDQSDGDASSASDLPKKKKDYSLSGSGFYMPDEIKKLLERVTCCSCGKQLNPMNHGAVRKHPWLKVVTCKKCFKFLRSGPFTRDDDGIDEQCRWCGDGGRLYGCDYCHNCFCRSCIKRNLGRSEATMMENDDDSKWHCYICKPKKVRKLADDCDKILRYIDAQEKKEQEKEERAKKREEEKTKQREKEKSEKSKDNKQEKEKNDNEDKKEEKATPKRGLPAPKDKAQIAVELTEKKVMDTVKARATAQSAPDIIIVGDGPSFPDNPHHRAVNYKPDTKTGVKHVQKISSNVTAVTVGPKNDKPVVMPFPTKGSGQIRQGIQKPLLAGMLSAGSGASSSNYNLEKMTLKKMPPLNDLRAMKHNIFPYNVETYAEKLSTMAQSFNLTMNSIKTDLAIAKLSQSNMFLAKQMAATQMKNGLEYFFNNMRELLNVQITAQNPNDVKDDKGQGDTKSLSSSSLTSTPSKPMSLVNALAGNLNESLIPIEIDASPVKKVEKIEKMETDKKVEKIEKMETDDDDVVVVTNNETKDTELVHLSDDKVAKVEKIIGKSENDEGKDDVVLCDDSPSEGETENKNILESNDDKSKEENLNEKEKPEDSICTEDDKGSNSETSTKSEKEKKADDKNEENNAESVDETSNNEIVNENTAAELELLKEMADELNETEENTTESDQPRRSTRTRNIEKPETQSESDRESPVRRSTRQRQKPENDRTEKKSTTGKGKSENTKGEDEENKVKEKKIEKKSNSKSTINYESEDENSDEEITKKGGKKSSGKDKKMSKGQKSSESIKTGDESDDNTEEEPGIKIKIKLGKSPKTKKMTGNKSNIVVESDEETEEEEITEKKKAKRGSKDDLKKSDKVDKKDMAIEDEVPTDNSDTTESSDESLQEFGKKKKKRKVVKEAETSSRRQTRQKAKKSENTTENSESDYDSDLEKEIKSLSKDTKVSKTKTKESADKRKDESEEKRDKLKGKKDKIAKKSVKEEDSDVSTGSNDIPEAKSSRRTTRKTDEKSDNSSENVDSDPEYDSDLEKDIKSLSKDTRLTRTRAKESQENKKEEKKGRKEESKGRKEENEDEKEKTKEHGEKKKRRTVDDEISDLSSDMDVPSDIDNDSDEDSEKEITASQLKKLKQADKAAIEDESDDNDDRPDDLSSDSSDDPEVSFPKLSTPKKGKKHHAAEDVSEDSDFVTPKKKRKRPTVKDKLLDAKISDSDSETGKKGKGKGKKGRRKRKKEDSDAFSELSDEEENRKSGKGKKRRRIKKVESSGDEKERGEDDDVAGSDDDDDDTPGGFLKRKQIRKVIGSKKLTDETRAAQKAEEERRKRIEERQKEYNTYVEVEGGEPEEEDQVPEGTEREMTTPIKADSIAQILGSPKKVPVTTKCVLEMDKENKKTLIEVDRTLVRKLKPHQVEAVRFMYNCCVENLARLKKGEGSGCILAHCMGLGKTLSVITFIHTMLSNVKLTKMTKCLVVCPLNTTLNWVNEFEIWLDDVDFEIEVYEMSKVKQNYERAQMLKEWHEGDAAVMIMGYDMYRNLVNGSHCKNKKQKKIFSETLADPGPDLVVCDEGHILKNDATSLSKSMLKIATPRRVVLTGTPLQNNLGEYHCMVSFVKPSLIGTRKEFNNRFCNPITNGQCSDSTPFDVKLMKRRAHILHELLAGCVQRKDYSALTKFLPPKFEYVISVRLSKVQMTLYEKYLDMNVGSGTSQEMYSKGARLFKDYQALMRIWTHPWVLKLDEIRQENKRPFDDEDDDSFINDSGSDEDSFVDDSTTSESNQSDDDADKKKKKRKTRGDKGSSSSDEDSKKENPDEVVKKWTSKRRGNEEGAGSSWMEDMGYGKPGPKEVTSEWWAEFVKEEDEFRLELSGKMTLMFEILKMCEDIGDKVLVFSQSLLSLDIIEDFLAKVDEANNPINETSEADKNKPSTSGENGAEKSAADKSKPSTSGENGVEKSEADKNKEKLAQYGKSWSKGLDYFRMDGSTNSQNRKASQDMFNDPENYRARLFLISTKAGSLGINLVSANRVIIFDASWNPSHDIQSIFRVYRFGQVKPVYVYRFLAQGTMEEKIYERQVTKQSLSQRVVDEHQIERHFTSSDLQELYKFQPDRLDDPEKTDKPLPILPKDHMLAELMTNNKDWIVTYHEHDSLLENVIEQELTEEEKKAAWEDYEDEKKGISKAMGGMQMNPAFLATQQMNMQNLLMQGQANLGQAAVLQIVQDLKARFPNLPAEVFQQRVQAVLRQVLTQQIMQQSDMQRRQIEQQRMNELNRLNQIKQQIQRQQAMISGQQRVYSHNNPGGMQSMIQPGLRPQTMSQLQMRPNTNSNDQQKK